MILIWGRTTRKVVRPDSTDILGAKPRCPMRGCGGVCKLYKMTNYCHMYWIPCFPSGEPRDVVQCLQCRAMFDFQEYQGVQTAVRNVAARAKAAASTETSKERKVVALLRTNQFAEAEEKARGMLKKDPMKINSMCHLNVALNGMGKTQESDKLACQIVFHWYTHCRKSWIARGRPKEFSAFPRVMLNHKPGLADYRVEAKQYFEPEKVDNKRTALYKVLVIPQDESGDREHSFAPGKRLFKLVQVRRGGGDTYVLSAILPSGEFRDAISYAESKPDIQKVAADVASFMGDADTHIPMAHAEAFSETNPLAAAMQSIPEVV